MHMKHLKGYALWMVLISIVVFSITYLIIPIGDQIKIEYAKQRIEAIYDTHFNSTD